MIFIILYCIFWLFVAYWIIQVPILIATKRGISESELSVISILSWCGIFLGITWLIAIVLSLIWQPTKWIDKNNQTISHHNNLSNLELLEKLNDLKNKGVITEQEFQKEKEKLIKL